MTKTTNANTTPAALQAHARELAKAFDVRLIESDQLKPDEALALPNLRVALVSPVIDETTYAVALHEMGHLAAPLGFVPRVAGVVGRPDDMLRTQEDAAWDWAKHYALLWTPLMDRLANWARGTYDEPTPRPTAPRAPQPTPKPIDWSRYEQKGRTR
jgi:hypothetical protein